MAEAKKAYVCRECGYDAPKWLGKCPACGMWDTFDELVVAKKGSSVAAAVTSSAVPKAKPQKVQDIKTGETKRIDIGQSEVNRVLGGGLVPGSIILVGGEPGIGKSTLALQLALADNGLRTLYVSGEESAEQIKMRAERLGIHNEECVVYTETLLENIIAQCEAIKPDMVVVDSIQTIYTDLVDASAGSVSQIRECASTLLKYAKGSGTPVFIIGHITKEGTIAGPKVLEHIVDVVLQFEGDGNNTYRILRGIKNRFGATFEIGVFEMLEKGLRSVENPSEVLLSHYDEPLSGISVAATVDGVRPYLLEVQALVGTAAYGTPQRNATGYDSRRMNMLLAILEKRVGLKMFQKDVFLNFAGGFKVSDTGLDLAVVAAVLSSYFDRPINDGLALAGEIGLSGEVRPAPRTEQRISEAARLGFKKIVVSGYASLPSKKIKGIEIARINTVGELARHLFSANEE
ncbi:MAG: DNA repair protein RadA [Alistipes sp.]|nr:DNA repair protein RadA [Alistipes sp.]